MLIFQGNNYNYQISPEKLLLTSDTQQTIDVPLDLNRSLCWNIDGRVLKSFTCSDQLGENYTIEGNESELSRIKIQLANRIMYRNVQQFYRDALLIGTGGSSEVYSVRNYLNDQGINIAVKVIDKTYLEKEGINGKMGLFIEINNMTKIQHPNLIKLHEVYEGDSKYYMIMDHLKGGNLQDLIAEHARLKSKIPLLQIKFIMRGILEGVNYLHQQVNMMHRDLKPENILFVDKNRNALKIADFGLATLVDLGQYHYQKCGTPGYVAPEVLNLNPSQRTYGKICDIFSVGAIFYKLLTLSELFQGNSPHLILQENKKCKINFARLALFGVPLDAQNLLKKMLDTNHETRITAADALLHQYFSEQQIKRQMDAQDKKQLFQNQKLSSNNLSIASSRKSTKQTRKVNDHQIFWQSQNFDLKIPNFLQINNESSLQSNMIYEHNSCFPLIIDPGVFGINIENDQFSTKMYRQSLFRDLRFFSFDENLQESEKQMSFYNNYPKRMKNNQ